MTDLKNQSIRRTLENCYYICIVKTTDLTVGSVAPCLHQIWCCKNNKGLCVSWKLIFLWQVMRIERHLEIDFHFLSLLALSQYSESSFTFQPTVHFSSIGECFPPVNSLTYPAEGRFVFSSYCLALFYTTAISPVNPSAVCGCERKPLVDHFSLRHL